MPDLVGGEMLRFEYLISKLISNSLNRIIGQNKSFITINCRYVAAIENDMDSVPHLLFEVVD